MDLTDIIDVRDIIECYMLVEDATEADERDERDALRAILDDLAGNGGDEEWRGDWYPVTLIRDSYFEEYAQELADDIGAINRNATWPTNCIDWDRAVRELQMDYTSIEIGGETYWYR